MAEGMRCAILVAGMMSCGMAVACEALTQPRIGYGYEIHFKQLSDHHWCYYRAADYSVFLFRTGKGAEYGAGFYIGKRPAFSYEYEVRRGSPETGQLDGRWASWVPRNFSWAKASRNSTPLLRRNARMIR